MPVVPLWCTAMQQQAAGLTRSAGPGGEAGAVVMVHNLVADRISCDMLFNVFCAYGNVVRVSVSLCCDLYCMAVILW